VDYIECVVSMASRKDGGGKSRSFGWSTGWLPGGKGAVGAKKVLVVVVKEVAGVKGAGVEEVMASVRVWLCLRVWWEMRGARDGLVLREALGLPGS